MFQLEENVVHSVISKMIIGEELSASHDQPTQTIVIHKSEPTPLQTLALQFADKAGQFVEGNERLLDTRYGIYGHKDKYQGNSGSVGYRNRGYRGGRGGRGGRGRSSGGLRGRGRGRRH